MSLKIYIFYLKMSHNAFFSIIYLTLLLYLLALSIKFTLKIKNVIASYITIKMPLLNFNIIQKLVGSTKKGEKN